MIINQKLADVVKDKDKRIETLHRLCFHNNPNCLIELEGISPLADDRTQVNPPPTHSPHQFNETLSLF